MIAFNVEILALDNASSTVLEDGGILGRHDCSTIN
jgi:hypothetical protein